MWVRDQKEKNIIIKCPLCNVLYGIHAWNNFEMHKSRILSPIRRKVSSNVCSVQKSRHNTSLNTYTQLP